MALIVNSTKYSGEVVEKLLVRATTTNELVDGGYVHVHPGIKSRLTLPRVRTGKMLQRRVAMPVSGAGGTSKGDFNYDEKYLEPQDVMAYTEFNPATFEHIWRAFQPQGEMVFQELPTEVQEQLLSEMAKVIDMELGEMFVIGKKGAGAREFFDGILTRIVLDPETIKIVSAYQIKEDNILAVLRTIKTTIPKSLRKSKKLKIFMSVEDFDIFDAVITDKPYKGADYSNMNTERYKGIPIVVLSDMPKDVIFVAEGTNGQDSNLWVGVNLSEDSNAIQVDKVANNGELYFFKMLMKADTNTVYGEDIVLWDGRGVVAPAAAFMPTSMLLSNVTNGETDLESKALELAQLEADLQAEKERLDALALDLEAKETALLDLENETGGSGLTDEDLDETKTK